MATPTNSEYAASTPVAAVDNPLHRLHHLLSAELQQLNEILLANLNSELPVITEIAKYLIAAGGKRLRPLLLVACARMLGYRGNKHTFLAACVEFIHSATLLHDDVVDNSSLRRGQSTANLVWGNKISILVGDFLFSRSFRLMVAQGNLEVLAVLAETSNTIAEGEVMQLRNALNFEITVDDYLKIVESKTAALFSAACRVGALVADSSAAVVAACSEFGKNLGIAFQLTDDVLDYSQTDIGKERGDDFREGKITMPVLLAYQQGDAAEQEFWRQAFADTKIEHFTQAQALLRRRQAVEHTLALAQQFITNARSALASISTETTEPALETEIYQLLHQILDYISQRAQ